MSNGRTDSVRFGLSDVAFTRWWETALLPEDADEFVHLYGGNKVAARFVCALDYLSATGQKRPPTDIIVRAYILAQKYDDEQSGEDKIRMEAQAVYAWDCVEALLERLRYRDRHAAIERVSTLVLKVVEEKLKEGFDADAAKVGTTLMGLDIREKAREDNIRRDRATRAAMERSRAMIQDNNAPPSIEEVRHALVMWRELFGVEMLRQLVTSALPINGQADTKTTTIESD